jgi:hypothetical protein
MDLSRFKVIADSFDHPSWLHGVDHTLRVMAMTWCIGSELGMEKERDLAFCAAYIHDLARKHDGVCAEHGPEAAEFKLPLFADFFRSQGVDDEGLESIRTAVYWHSLPGEIPLDDPHYKVTALLEDADALDRIRLGPFNLKPELLRFDLARKLIPASRRFFQRTVSWKGAEVERYIDLFQSICRRYLRRS